VFFFQLLFSHRTDRKSVVVVACSAVHRVTLRCDVDAIHGVALRPRLGAVAVVPWSFIVAGRANTSLVDVCLGLAGRR